MDGQWGTVRCEIGAIRDALEILNRPVLMKLRSNVNAQSSPRVAMASVLIATWFVLSSEGRQGIRLHSRWSRGISDASLEKPKATGKDANTLWPLPGWWPIYMSRPVRPDNLISDLSLLITSRDFFPISRGISFVLITFLYLVTTMESTLKFILVYLMSK